ncbi:hypothetical protein DUNSADRAFT_16545 [Dunaliella salina]|uniref:Uncharacterized protein n=1 Tax=Dunaliella salina TaxID=3046 RepID=A0ABQ7G3C8_DUNSA|nr:hypothetical protein DUNSADRAFT_16545 [Dunaliella salina]|eukprot:KAF5829108.1 hypothetical protein DUNSADRAFT_16545 [Dunaliella salina]
MPWLWVRKAVALWSVAHGLCAGRLLLLNAHHAAVVASELVSVVLAGMGGWGWGAPISWGVRLGGWRVQAAWRSARAAAADPGRTSSVVALGFVVRAAAAGAATLWT